MTHYACSGTYMEIFEGNAELWRKIHAHILQVVAKSFGDAMLSTVLKISQDDFNPADVRSSMKNTVSKIFVVLGEDATYNLLANSVEAIAGKDTSMIEACYELIKEVSA